MPVSTPEAEFSDEARRAHFEGTVVFQVLVSEDGLPSKAKIVAPAGKGLDEKALAAVGKYRFRPATLEGMPVPFLMFVVVHFRLE